MERDAAMMAYAGIDGVLVKATPANLADSNFQERLREFGRILRQNGIPGVTVFLTVPEDNSGNAVRRDNLLRYLTRIGFHGWDGILKHDGTMAILVSSRLALTGVTPPQSAISILHENTDFPARPFGTVTQHTIITPINGFVRIRAGEAAGSTDFSTNAQKTSWILPRLKGDALKTQLEICRNNANISTVILDSWNDYRDGSQVEPDSITRTRFVEILAEFQ
jgi:hypothetical protein